MIIPIRRFESLKMEQQRLFQDILPDDFLQFSFSGKSYSENIKTEVVKSDLSAGIKVFLCKSEVCLFSI